MDRPTLNPLIHAVVVTLLLSACGSPSPRVVKLDPMHVEAVEVDGERSIEIMDPQVLFDEAGKAFQASDYATAARKYTLIVERFPSSRWADVSRYNGGLALQRSGRCPEAVTLFTQMITRLAGSKDAQDGLFQVATCHEQTGSWPEAQAALDRLLLPEYERISAVTRVEAQALRGMALQAQGEAAHAERDYKAALSLYKENIDHPALQRSRYVSMAQFQIAEIYRDLFSAIRFRLPVERMEKDLEVKANLFLKCQAAYLRTVRLQHPDYSVRGGFRLGEIFETFYDHLLSAEVPEDLSEEEIQVYYEALKENTQPLVKKAVDVFERNLMLGQRMGQSGEWVRKTEASLTRLRELLRDDMAREALRKATSEKEAEKAAPPEKK